MSRRPLGLVLGGIVACAIVACSIVVIHAHAASTPAGVAVTACVALPLAALVGALVRSREAKDGAFAILVALAAIAGAVVVAVYGPGLVQMEKPEAFPITAALWHAVRDGAFVLAPLLIFTVIFDLFLMIGLAMLAASLPYAIAIVGPVIAALIAALVAMPIAALLRRLART